MDSFCRFSGDSSEKFALQEIRCKSCILVRSERIVAVSKKLILYSYIHLVDSFIAETRIIENNYPEVLVSVGKFFFEQHLSSRLLNKPLDDTVIRAQSTLTNIL